MIDEITVKRLRNQCAAADQIETPSFEEFTPEEPGTPGEMGTEELINTLGNLGFSVLAPNWKVSPQEVADIAAPAAEVLEKYFPEGVSTKFGAEVALISAAAMVIYPRLGMPRKLEEKEVKSEQKPEPKPQPKPKQPEPDEVPEGVINLD